jgi:hypothetical protein
MKVCTFTIPTKDEEIFQKFDEWVKDHPQYFESSRKSRNGGLRSAALVGLMKFIVENPREFAKMYAHELGQLDLFENESSELQTP